MPKIYTKTGDKGETALPSGERVSKDHQRLQVCGSLDELNCQLGFAATLISTGPGTELQQLISDIQRQLFCLGAEIAAEGANSYCSHSQLSEWIDSFERTIDRFSNLLPELRSFILPGGSQAAAALHVCRSVCRRAERELVKLSRQSLIERQILTYINRLSDLLFVAGRYALQIEGKNDVIWKLYTPRD